MQEQISSARVELNVARAAIFGILRAPMNAIQSFCALSAFLILGKALRTFTPFFRALYLPASVIGGLVALAVVNIPGAEEHASWFTGWSALPGFLINIVFASLFIGQKFPSMAKYRRAVAEQLCFGQIMAWGMYVAGIGATMLALGPVFGVPAEFGTLLEIGFEGGHGTVGGMAGVFENLGWEAGPALGYTTATVGMLVGIIAGMAMVNRAVRKGVVAGMRSDEDMSNAEQHGFYPISEQPPAGRQTVLSASIDSLAWHVSMIGAAIGAGWLMHKGMVLAGGLLPENVRRLGIMESIPLFPLCMVGGLLLQWFLCAFGMEAIVDKGQMNRIGGAALDFLVVSALATIKISFVVQYWIPLAILLAAGVAWALFGAIFLAPRIMRGDVFQRTMCEFGQYTGVTATGLLLLRTVDPDNKTSARTVFGAKQLLHEPVMGGGVWTAMAVPLVVKLGPGTVLAISSAAVLLWVAFWLVFLRRRG